MKEMNMSKQVTVPITVTIRAKAFSGEGVREHRCSVDSDGVVRVWDSVAGHYTTCHSLSAGAIRRARLKAGYGKIVGGVWHGMTPAEVLADRDEYNRLCGE